MRKIIQITQTALLIIVVCIATSAKLVLPPV